MAEISSDVLGDVMTSTLLSRQGRRPHLTDRKVSPCFLLHFCDESKGVSLFSSFTSTALHPPSGKNLIRSFIPRVIGGLLGGCPSCCGQSRMKCPVSLQIWQVVTASSGLYPVARLRFSHRVSSVN